MLQMSLTTTSPNWRRASAAAAPLEIVYWWPLWCCSWVPCSCPSYCLFCDVSNLLEDLIRKYSSRSITPKQWPLGTRAGQRSENALSWMDEWMIEHMKVDTWTCLFDGTSATIFSLGYKWWRPWMEYLKKKFPHTFDYTDMLLHLDSSEPYASNTAYTVC